MGYGLLHGPLEAKPLLASTCGRLSEIALVIAAVITGVLRLIRTDVTWAAGRIGCLSESPVARPSPPAPRQQTLDQTPLGRGSGMTRRNQSEHGSGRPRGGYQHC